MKAKPKKSPTYDRLPYGTNILALDVSSRVTGWAVGKFAECQTLEVREFGCMKPPSGWEFGKRIGKMLDGIDSVVRNYQVTRVAMEWQDHRSGSMRVQGLAVLGQSQGAVWKHLSAFPVDRIPVRDATKLNGRNAKKETRREWIKAQVPEYAERSKDPKYDLGSDASDALFLLIWRAKQGY